HAAHERGRLVHGGERGQLVAAHGLYGHVALQVERRVRDEVAQQRPVAEALGEDVGDQRLGARARRAGAGRVWRGRVEFGVQRGRPLPPGRGGQLEEDLLAGLEVAQQGRLVDADPRGDVGEAHRAHSVAQRQLAGGAKDGVPALELLLRAPGPLVRLGVDDRSSAHDESSVSSATPLCYYQTDVALSLTAKEHVMPQVFFLTGSSRGLGRQIAEAALAAGHYLVATAR